MESRAIDKSYHNPEGVAVAMDAVRQLNDPLNS